MSNNQAVALRFLHAMGAGDGETVDQCLAAKAFTEARNFCSIGGKNDRQNLIAMVRLFPQFMPSGLHFEVLRIFGDSEFVAVECDGKAVTARGDIYNNKYCFTFCFKDGLISEIYEYFCSKLAEEIVWPMARDGLIRPELSVKEA